MSTRSAIIMKTAEGYAGVYCHFDGYEDGVGQILLDHYTDPAKVEKLIALGELSSLGERVDPIGPHSYDKRENGTTVAYHRDRGEDAIGPHVGKTIEEVGEQIGHNGYVYVFENDAWTCCGKEPVNGKFEDCYSSDFARKKRAA